MNLSKKLEHLIDVHTQNLEEQEENLRTAIETDQGRLWMLIPLIEELRDTVLVVDDFHVEVRQGKSPIFSAVIQGGYLSPDEGDEGAEFAYRWEIDVYADDGIGDQWNLLQWDFAKSAGEGEMLRFATVQAMINHMLNNIALGIAKQRHDGRFGADD